MDPNYTGHCYTGHNYTGHYYTGHNYIHRADALPHIFLLFSVGI